MTKIELIEGRRSRWRRPTATYQHYEILEGGGGAARPCVCALLAGLGRNLGA